MFTGKATEGNSKAGFWSDSGYFTQFSMFLPSLFLLSVTTTTNIIPWQKFSQDIKVDKSPTINFFVHFPLLHTSCAGPECHLLFSFTDLPNTRVLNEFPRPGHRVKQRMSKTSNGNKNIFWVDKYSSVTHHFVLLTNCHHNE